MPNEIRITVLASLTNGNVRLGISRGEKFFNQTVAKKYAQTVTVGTSEEVISLGPEITTPGFVFLTNLNAAGGNYVDWGPESGGAMVGLSRLRPQQTHIYYHMPGAVLRAKANGADVEVEVEVFAA